MLKWMSLSLAVVALSLVSVRAEESNNTNTDRTNASSLSKTDRDFAQAAAGGGTMEVKMGQLAQKHASSQNVKDFASRMVKDHQQANKELKSLAQNKGLTLDTKLDKSQKDEMETLSKLDGADFDKAYMAKMVKDHEEDVNEFKNAANHAADPDLKAFANKTLPTLEEHLKMAKDVRDNLNK